MLIGGGPRRAGRAPPACFAATSPVRGGFFAGSARAKGAPLRGELAEPARPEGLLPLASSGNVPRCRKRPKPFRPCGAPPLKGRPDCRKTLVGASIARPCPFVLQENCPRKCVAAVSWRATNGRPYTRNKAGMHFFDTLTSPEGEALTLIPPYAPCPGRSCCGRGHRRGSSTWPCPRGGT